MRVQRIELTTGESIELLQTCSIGRMCVIDHDYPLAIPVNYRIVGNDDEVRIVVRTAPDSILGHYEGPASLEVDDIALRTGHAWSVIVRGALRRVNGSHDLPDPDPLPSDGRQQWMTLTKSAISGRRFRVHAADDGFSVAWQIAPA